MLLPIQYCGVLLLGETVSIGNWAPFYVGGLVVILVILLFSLRLGSPLSDILSPQRLRDDESVKQLRDFQLDQRARTLEIFGVDAEVAQVEKSVLQQVVQAMKNHLAVTRCGRPGIQKPD